MNQNIHRTGVNRSQGWLKQSVSKQDILDYMKMVLSPFNSECVRGPSKFFQPTSILNYKLEYDFTPGTQNAALCVLPHAFSLQQITNGFGFFNVNKDIIPGTTSNYTFAVGTVTAPNQVYVHPLAGGGSVNLNPQDLSAASFMDSSRRWMTARCNALGIRIFATGQQINRTGTLTLGILPGSSQIFNNSFIPVPSATGLRQYPTSYEISTAGIGAQGTDLIWLPLDPLDDVFIPGQVLIGSNDLAQEAFYRNQMWVLFNGITNTDTFRIEVVTHLEYIPTLQFGTWSPPEAPSLQPAQLAGFFKEVRTNLSEVISGDMGKAMCGAAELGRKASKGVALIASVLN